MGIMSVITNIFKKKVTVNKVEAEPNATGQSEFFKAMRKVSHIPEYNEEEVEKYIRKKIYTLARCRQQECFISSDSMFHKEEELGVIRNRVVLDRVLAKLKAEGFGVSYAYLRVFDIDQWHITWK